jgi:menaquinone-dependent protoporphyrinogen oxidase
MLVLVTAASRHGATAEIAAAIARVLRLRGIETVELPPAEVTDIDTYDAIVLGSAVYVGRWMQPALSFVSRFETRFANRSVWLFSSGPIGVPPSPVQGPDMSGVLATTGAVEHRELGGKLDKEKLGLLERGAVRLVHAPEGDYRDWGEASHWATEIADTLVAVKANS